MNLRFGILTISDRVSRGQADDRGGVAVESALQHPEWAIARRDTVADEASLIAARLREWADEDALDVIFTTGGTGLGPRDVTPEATLTVVTRMAPGIADGIRNASLAQTQTAMLSRATAGVRGNTLIINLPGSPRGAQEGVEVVLPILEHAVATMHGAGH